MAVIIRLIQDEASLWAIVGAKHLSNVMQESNLVSLWLLFYKLLLLINKKVNIFPCSNKKSTKPINKNDTCTCDIIDIANWIFFLKVL